MYSHAHPSQAIKWSLVFLALGVGAGVCGFLQQIGFGYCGHKLAQRVRMLMLSSVLRQVCKQPDSSDPIDLRIVRCELSVANSPLRIVR